MTQTLTQTHTLMQTQKKSDQVCFVDVKQVIGSILTFYPLSHSSLLHPKNSYTHFDIQKHSPIYTHKFTLKHTHKHTNFQMNYLLLPKRTWIMILCSTLTD